MAKGKVMQTTINIGGGIDESLGSAIDRAVKNLDKISDAAIEAAGAAGKLSDKIRDQEKALADAQRQYASYVLAGEESSDQAQELADTIKDLARELDGNKRAFKAAEQAAERLADDFDDTGQESNNLKDSLEDVDKAARDTKGGFTIMKGALANLIATGITRLIDTATNAVTSLYGLAESTREYREDIGKLESAWEAAGKSTELATDTYKSFYSVLGEEDRSVEAVNHLAKFVDTEKDMSKWTDIATGVWATFGDSLPIEGLTEAANETAKVGEVTGVLADALNWAGVNEDQFQAQLDAASTEQERVALITETLSGLYDEAADRYRENNASIIEARLATSDYTDSIAEMGERIEPVTTAVTSGLAGIAGKALEMTDGIDWEEAAGKIENAFDRIGGAIDWVSENGEFLLKVITLLSGALAVYNTSAIVEKIVSIGSAAKSLWSIIAANPLGAALLAITALIVAGKMLYENWDTIKAKAAQLSDYIENKWNGLKTSAKETVDSILGWFVSGFNSLVGIVMGPIEKITGMIDGVKDKFDSFKSGVSDKISGAAATVSGWLPEFASGGFTSGPSIAGEAGTEAVISFDPSYRDANLSYWARAGRLLGVTADDMDFSLSGDSSGTMIDFGGVTFAPNIQVSGNADKQTIMEAIEAAFPEFEDLLDRVDEKRRRTVWQT